MEYQREAFERDEQEGENIEHRRDANGKADSSKMVYRTNGGRVVYGGGGITPDYIVRPLSLSKSSEDLFRRDMFYQFITTYLDGEGQKLRASYGSNRKQFMHSFVIADDVLEKFQTFIKTKNVTVEGKEIHQDDVYIRARLKADIARAFWGNDGWYPVMLQVDPQFQKALTLLPEAMKIAKLN